MRLLIIGLFYFGTILNVAGQSVKIERVTEKDILISPYELNSVRRFTDIKYITFKVIEQWTAIGAHPDSVGQEVMLSDFLFVVRERFDDDRPDESSNFWVKGKFYNPRDFKFNKADKSLTFKHGSVPKSKTTTLFVSTREIKIK
jgi:hypothetical protein